MENLKKVVLNELNDEQVAEHKENVMKLEDDQIVEYLKYAIDTFYLTEEEGENNESVISFFDSEEFKPFYEKIMTEEGVELDETPEE